MDDGPVLEENHTLRLVEHLAGRLFYRVSSVTKFASAASARDGLSDQGLEGSLDNPLREVGNLR